MSDIPKDDPQRGYPADASANSPDGESSRPDVAQVVFGPPQLANPEAGRSDVHDSRSQEINWQAIADGDSNVEPGSAEETAHGMIDWESLITRSDVAKGLDLRDNDLGQAVANLVAYASDLGASDLFLGSYESDLCIAVRHLGILERVSRVSKDEGRRVLNHIKALGGMDLGQRLRPQDGRWVVDLPNGRRVDLRISTVPTLHGEDMAIRLLDRDMRLMALENLGMHPQDLGKLQSMLSSPSGLILVTGPTGAGKTTTLYACLNYLNNGTRKINTIEDPIEYSLEGVHQSQVNWKIDLDFPELLRSLLRQSANVIMIGEVRDPITAATAVRAAKSGTVVFATLHAATATAAIDAMLALDVHPHFLATSLLGVIAQRLVRTLCPKCKEGFDISESPGTLEDVRQWLAPDQGQQIYSAPGCDKCGHAGYTGRTGVFELFRLTREMRRLIANRQSVSDIRDLAIQKGMFDVRRSALLKVAEGITSTRRGNARDSERTPHARQRGVERKGYGNDDPQTATTSTRGEKPIAEKFFAVFPREAEGAHIGNAKTGNDGRKGLGVALGKLAVHHGVLGPIHQLRQRDLVVKIPGDFVSDGLLCDCHGCILHFLVAFIHREFLMRLDQFALVVVYLLPEAQGGFARVHFLEIPRQPAQPACHIQPVTPSAAGQFIPLAELLFVLRSRTHLASSCNPRRDSHSSSYSPGMSLGNATREDQSLVSSCRDGLWWWAGRCRRVVFRAILAGYQGASQARNAQGIASDGEFENQSPQCSEAEPVQEPTAPLSKAKIRLGSRIALGLLVAYVVVSATRLRAGTFPFAICTIVRAPYDLRLCSVVSVGAARSTISLARRGGDVDIHCRCDR